jgi:hypothetical protein
MAITPSLKAVNRSLFIAFSSPGQNRRDRPAGWRSGQPDCVICHDFTPLGS